MSVAKRGLFIIIASFVAVMAGGGTVLAIENSGIGGKPAHPRADNPRTSSIFVYELKPGDRTDDAVRVVNNTSKQKTLLVYAVDSQVASDGAFACAQKVDDSVNVGTWIKLAKDKVTLAANTTEDVQFTVNVPKTASAGEQNGCIVIQDSEQTPAAQGNGVSLSFRSAIRVAITVPGDISKQLVFSGPISIKVEKDIIKLAVGLRNNGNVSLDSDITARVKTFYGGTARSAGSTYPVLAHSQAMFNFEVKKTFWGGWYKIQATAAYNSDPSKSIGQSGSKTTITGPSTWLFIAPQPAAAAIEIAVLAVLAGGLATYLLRKRHHRKLRASARPYRVKENESLQTIAKKYHVSWKTVAKLNHLKAPYHLEAGQVVRIPVRAGLESKNDKTDQAD